MNCFLSFYQASLSNQNSTNLKEGNFMLKIYFIIGLTLQPDALGANGLKKVHLPKPYNETMANAKLWE